LLPPTELELLLDETPELDVSELLDELEVLVEFEFEVVVESVPVLLDVVPVLVVVLVDVSAPASVTPTISAIVSPMPAAAIAAPAAPARCSSRLEVVGSFIATTLAAHGLGGSQPTIKAVLRIAGSHLSRASSGRPISHEIAAIGGR
jgi:hypothetical protein